MASEVVFVESNLTGYNAIALSLARERGYRTHFVARTRQDYEGMSPDVLGLADRVSVVDTYDTGKLLWLVSQRQVRGMVAVDDYRLIPTACVARELGLPHADVSGLVNTHFKDRARALTNEVGDPVRGVVVSREDAGDRSPLGYPCVVKPIDDSGSTGVRVCHGDEDYRDALARAAAVQVNLRGYTCAPSLLVEEWVPGVEYTAECLWDTERHRWQLVGYTKKLLGPPPFPIETGAVFPYFFPEELDSAIERTVYGWLAATGHRYGSAHVEFKVDGDRVRLIEINPRLGGDQIRDLIKISSGFDTIDAYLRLYLGERVAVRRAPSAGRVATILFKLPEAPGLYQCQEPDSADFPGYVRSSFSKTPVEIRSLRDNDDRLGYVITLGADVEESEARARRYVDAVRAERLS